MATHNHCVAMLEKDVLYWVWGCTLLVRRGLRDRISGCTGLLAGPVLGKIASDTLSSLLSEITKDVLFLSGQRCCSALSPRSNESLSKWIQIHDGHLYGSSAGVYSLRSSSILWFYNLKPVYEYLTWGSANERRTQGASDVFVLENIMGIYFLILKMLLNIS